MRVKTDDRRQAFMNAALFVFREVGFERASMSEISARAGGSKATLYNYFTSKEDLYTETMLAEIDRQAIELTKILDLSHGSIKDALTKFCTSYLEIVLSPEVIANKRTAISQSVNSNIGAILYERGERRAWARAAAYLAQRMTVGDLKRGDPEIAALQLQGLLECGMLEPRLYGSSCLHSIGDAVARAVETFLLIY